MSQRTGSLMSLKEPKFLTLCRQPANSTAFKIVRSDEGGVAKASLQRVMKRTVGKPKTKTVKKSDENGALLMIMVPEGVTAEEAQKVMGEYGLNDDYELRETDDGQVIVLRSLEEMDNAYVSVNLPDGMKAVIRHTAKAARSDSKNIAVASIKFNADVWTEDGVVMWAEENSVNFSDIVRDTECSTVILQRHDLQDGETSYTIPVEDGIEVEIVAREAEDIPAVYYTEVIQVGYGRYGWGQVDFLGAMADSEFSKIMSDAIWMLREVLDNIVFYNDYPTAMKKALLKRALTQFGEFSDTLIDSLPQDMVIALRSDMVEKQSKKTEGRSAPAKSDEVKQMSDDAAQKAAAEAAKTKAASDTEVNGTTEDTTTETDVQRGDGDPMTKMVGILENMQESLKAQRADQEKNNNELTKVGETVSALAKRLDALESSVTVHRSDDTDTEAETKPETKPVKRDVFDGMLAGTGIHSR